MGWLSTACTIGAKIVGGRKKRKAAKRAATQTIAISQMGYDKAIKHGLQAARMARFRGCGERSGLGRGGMSRYGSMKLRLSP